MRSLFLLLLALPLLAQQLPQNWAGVGFALNQASKPPVAGWVSYAGLISGRGQIYSISTHDVFLTQTKPHILASSARTGLATVLRTLGPIIILGLGDAGMAASGTSIGGAYSGGGIGMIRLGKTDWSIVLGGRLLKTANGGSQAVYEIGLGRSF